MSITTLSAVLAAWGPQGAFQSQSAITALLPIADAVLKQYCKRDLESNTYTEYYSGRGQRDLVLRQRPLASAGAVQSVYFDPQGWWGQNPNGSFPASTLLVQGTDYAVRLEDNGVGCSGLLYRIASPFVAYGQRGTMWGGMGAPMWTYGEGNIKVTYTAGYTPATTSTPTGPVIGGTTMPIDLIQAGALLVIWMMRNNPLGVNGLALTSESVGAYSYSLSQLDIPEVGGIRQLLSRYREISF